MVCPQCGAEYRPGFTECADCHLALVVPPPQPMGSPRATPEQHLDLVTVFATGNPALIAIAQSVLRAADINFATRGEDVQEIMGLGRFPFGANLIAGPVELQVRLEDADDARALLVDIEESALDIDELDDDVGDDS
jgi:hypothetical protein